MDFKLRKPPASIPALCVNGITPEKQVGGVFPSREGGRGRFSSPFPPEMPLDICLKARLQGMFEQRPAQFCASLGEFMLQARNLKPETKQSRGSTEKRGLGLQRQDKPGGINPEFTDKTSLGMSTRP